MWLVNAYAPLGGNTCSFVWSINTNSACMVPDDPRFYAIVRANADLEAAGVFGDLDLLALGDGEHKITGISQWGCDGEGNPIAHQWVLEAGIVPEPSMLAFVAFALVGVSRLRWRPSAR